MKDRDLDSPSGHIVCAMVIFLVGAVMYMCHYDYGKEIMAGALGSLFTALQVRKPAELVHEARVVNQDISISEPERNK